MENGNGLSGFCLRRLLHQHKDRPHCRPRRSCSVWWSSVRNQSSCEVSMVRHMPRAQRPDDYQGGPRMSHTKTNGLCEHGLAIDDWCQRCEEMLVGPYEAPRCSHCYRILMAAGQRCSNGGICSPVHQHTWECLDASGRCLITGEV